MLATGSSSGASKVWVASIIAGNLSSICSITIGSGSISDPGKVSGSSAR
jgi:hypothetical protein